MPFCGGIVAQAAALFAVIACKVGQETSLVSGGLGGTGKGNAKGTWVGANVGGGGRGGKGGVKGMANNGITECNHPAYVLYTHLIAKKMCPLQFI